MFADAYALAQHFARPLVISTRRLNGAVESNVATWVLLNADGWFLTAGHVFGVWRDFELHLSEVTRYRAAEAAIAADPALEGDARRAAVERLAATVDLAWIENCSAWWGTDGLAFRDVSVIGELDLALGRRGGVRAAHGPGDLAVQARRRRGDHAAGAGARGDGHEVNPVPIVAFLEYLLAGQKRLLPGDAAQGVQLCGVELTKELAGFERDHSCTLRESMAR